MVMMAKMMTMTYIMTIYTIIDGQDDDFEYTTINLNHSYGNDFELDHLQDVDISNIQSYSVIVIFSHSHI